MQYRCAALSGKLCGGDVLPARALRFPDGDRPGAKRRFCGQASLRLVGRWSCILAILTSSCNPTPSQAPDPLAVHLENAQNPLTIPTYDGSGQVTEPSVVFFDSPWHGFRYWMAFSPYPNGDASKENPSIVVSDDGKTWQAPPGLANPLALPGQVGYLADASIFYDCKSDRLWVYYLDTQPATGNLGVKRLISSDGIQWQSQGTLFEIPAYNAESPTVEKAAGGYYMWAVNSGTAGCSAASTVVEYRLSTDGINWSAPQPANLLQSGYEIWHLNVSYISSKQEYWALLAAYPAGSDCGHTVLFYSTSLDGMNWTSNSKIVLAPGMTWDNAEIYRSTLLYDLDSNSLSVWYSASSKLGEWHIGLAEVDYDQFLEWLSP